ncbi:MAG: hypothetical protein GY729_06910 [Desulfobacteraceae bacterium]|nr:hypothetical protein [Desulfobacteraceae bacterium]
MIKPYGRKTKKKVGQILKLGNQSKAFERLIKIPNEQLIGHLFSHFYHEDEKIKFRSVAAMGALGARLAKVKMENARNLLRRIMWNLNDESGGIGWGSPEAMGEILANNTDLAQEFESILYSYLDPNGNFIEHEMLQRGVLWGVGTYLETVVAQNDKTIGIIYGFLHSSDPVKKGYAIRALINADCFDCSLVPEHIVTDEQEIDIFDGWFFVKAKICDLMLSCRNHKLLV